MSDRRETRRGLWGCVMREEEDPKDRRGQEDPKDRWSRREDLKDL